MNKAKVGKIVGIGGVLLSILFPPYFMAGGHAAYNLSGYGFLFGEFMKRSTPYPVIDHINFTNLLIQLLVFIVIGFGLYYMENLKANDNK